MADVLSFEVDGHDVQVDLVLLTQHSSLPTGKWLDELINAYKHESTREEVEAFLEAVAGRDSWRMNGMSKVDLGPRFAVLRLATQWQCEGLRNLAIDSLEKLLTPLERLVVARAYRVIHWLVPAYTCLTLRYDPLSVAEARKLDAKDVVRIFFARENIFRHRLPACEEFVTEHFLEVVLNEDLAMRADFNLPSASPATLPLPSYRDNEAIIFFGPSSVSDPTPPIMQREDSLIREEVPAGVVDISPFKEGRFDDGAPLLNSENVLEIVAQLLSVPDVLSGTETQGTSYRQYGSNLIVVAMRRSVREDDIIPIAAEFAGAILDFLKRQWFVNYHEPLSFSLQSLDSRWNLFIQTGIVPRQDNGQIMPLNLTPETYQAYMKNGQQFIVVLAGKGFVREWKWVAHARTFGSQDSPSFVSYLPVRESTATSSTTTSTRTAHELHGPISTRTRPPVMMNPSSHGNRTSRRARARELSAGSIASSFTSGSADAVFAQMTTTNVSAAFIEYLMQCSKHEQSKLVASGFFPALLRRACDDREFPVTGLQLLDAMCRGRPELIKKFAQPVDWVIANLKQFLRCPDMTPDPDEGKIVRRWQSPGLVPQLYKERVGNVRSFILNALTWLI